MSGERSVADLAETRRTPAEAAALLAEILDLPLPADSAGVGNEWSVAETELGVALPGDYRTFIGAYGPGLGA